MNRRLFQLFRAWIPSWRFFETLSDQAVLYYRCGENELSGEWRKALIRPPRQWYSVLLNGAGNRFLASYALLDQLEEDLSEMDATQVESMLQMPSYQLVQNLLCFIMRERNEAKAGTRYQFKFCRKLASSSDALEEIFVSPVHAL